MKVKDLVGEKFEFKIGQKGYDCEPVVDGEYVEEIHRAVIDCPAKGDSSLTLFYFETDKDGKYIEKDGDVARGSKKFAVSGMAELEILPGIPVESRAFL